MIPNQLGLRTKNRFGALQDMPCIRQQRKPFLTTFLKLNNILPTNIQLSRATVLSYGEGGQLTLF
ncbi:hypothetical protein CWI71_07640 [Pseudidiomarina insulisalsae]|uniref:Uncharacterized protein n=1 Tax=Pseudidiomarina insulisalsae TaxID=575789 RepID=A0A432YH54_9GAMM|nr:hypothetical protein CWI71_07640 [Pseudidiomarina insulisalsae]